MHGPANVEEGRDHAGSRVVEAVEGGVGGHMAIALGLVLEIKEGAQITDGSTDVNAQAVEASFREHGTPIMLHGHTHRPAVHTLSVDGKEAKRIVLGDWYTQGSVVRWDESGPVLSAMER